MRSVKFTRRPHGHSTGLGLVLVVAAAVATSCASGSQRGSEATENRGSGGAHTASVGSGGASMESSGGGLNIGGEFGAGGQAQSGGVPQTCAQALAQESYIGCEYWPTVTSNGLLFDGFSFTVVAANPTDSVAEITVERGGVEVATATVLPGEVGQIDLPWVAELKQDDPSFDGSALSSSLVVAGAYHLTSTFPITLYQFNPLEYELTPSPADCPQGLVNCLSYSNDASLLFPTSALGGEYYALSYPTLHMGHQDVTTLQTSWRDRPGFIAVTATQDKTEVEVLSSAYVRSGPGVAALTPGALGTYSMNAGDVLMLSSAAAPPQETPAPGKPCTQELLGLVGSTVMNRNTCPTDAAYDLTGTHVVANKPVSVLGGHDCTFIPYNRVACDHLEESMLPVEALGQKLVVTAPQDASGGNPIPGNPDSMFVRVLSAVDDNQITFEPAVNPPVTLDAGQWIELGPLTEDFVVLADDKISVAQYMVAGDYNGLSNGAGDPAQSIAIPVEQFRLAYTFLAPESYALNVVNIIIETGTTVALEGVPIAASESTPIGTTGYEVARHVIDGGSYHIEGDQNFGIVVYGYGLYTSYMYPGGLNLETVTIVPN